MRIDVAYGDEVTAVSLTGRPVAGVVCNLDFGPDDLVKFAAVREFVSGSILPVDPASLRWRTDKNGFSFAFKDGGLLIRRNDRKLYDPRWVRRKGAKLIRDSLAPKKK